MARFGVAVIVFSLLVFSTDASEPPLVFCDGYDISQLAKCKDNHGIRVDSAKYGRDQDIMCQPDVKDENSTRICRMKDVHDIISPLCDGKQKCAPLTINTTNLGEVEKCPQNVKKYLIMHIECLTIKEPDDDKTQRPNVVEASKKETINILQHEKARTSTGILFQVQHDSSTSVKPVGLFILLVLGTFCSLYS
ncbi:hypothetical protein C0Q70_16001 [Paramuricea clavata]|uniref:Uncharacterized protein n=1 Tax=Paramuricea clavata TaxID=317549 RepID=A0A7D9DIJ1_PARCT|nr:hypothetical protein C0Q70_16001 [Paramuricea clavata]